jgi:branched-chain amino acid aminotransferase
LKARRAAGGRLAIFRLPAHARRFASSARRMAMPPLPEEDFAACVIAFVRHQRVQLRDGQALYLRPLLFASEEMIGARPARRYTFAVLGAVVDEPADPGRIGVFVDPRYARTAPGGTGAAKTAGNYAAALLAHAEAARRGFQQPLFLDALEHAFVEETGATNVMFHARGRLLTPPLGDTILDGVTRRSVIALAPGLGLEVVEQPLPWRKVLADVKAGRITEAFGLGTGAGVLPIDRLGTEDETVGLAGGEVGRRLQEALRAERLGRGRRRWLTYAD